jgi:hydroxyacylglutathione hydrolase
MSDMGAAEEQQPVAPGWQRISDLASAADPFFASLWVLPGYELSSNIYVLTGDGLAIIDPGNDYTAFMELWKLGFAPTQVRKVVLTHGHLDHAMGAIELLRSYQPAFRECGLEVVMHEAGPREIREAITGFGARLTQLRGGETISLAGSAWEVIHTPGHTVDSLCLYHRPTRTLASGDTVLPHAMAEPDQTAGGRLDYYLASLRNLLQRDVANLLPGHDLPVLSAARVVLEQTYESLMMKTIGIEKQTSWMSGATALVEKGLLEEAVFCCDRELSRHPEDSRALQLKALCLNDLGRFDEALSVMDDLVRLAPAPDDPFVHLARGYALMGLHKYNESIGEFDAALRIKPDSKEAHVYRGMALYLAGRYDEAMDVAQFRTEFLSRFKHELAKQGKSSVE